MMLMDWRVYDCNGFGDYMIVMNLRLHNANGLEIIYMTVIGLRSCNSDGSDDLHFLLYL